MTNEMLTEAELLKLEQDKQAQLAYLKAQHPELKIAEDDEPAEVVAPSL